VEVKGHETDCRLWRLVKGGVQFRVHASIAHFSDVENDPASERRIQHDPHAIAPFSILVQDTCNKVFSCHEQSQ
jgi:hypothetical protein